MREAVIVSTARTGLAKSVRGGFNMTHGAVMGGHAIKHAIARAGIDPKDVEDVYMGCALPEGATGNNIARASAIWAGCPVTTAGTTINRFCSSGLQAIAMACPKIDLRWIDRDVRPDLTQHTRICDGARVPVAIWMAEITSMLEMEGAISTLPPVCLFSLFSWASNGAG